MRANQAEWIGAGACKGKTDGNVSVVSQVIAGSLRSATCVSLTGSVNVVNSYSKLLCLTAGKITGAGLPKKSIPFSVPPHYHRSVW